MSESNSPASQRITVRRGAQRAEYSNEMILEILRAGSIAHVGVNTAEGPLVLPMVYGITDEHMYVHGALANSLLKAGADAEVCATVTIVDGMVIAKSPFNHTMNYRSVVVRGAARVVTDEAEVMLALQLMTDHIVPTWDITRKPSVSEIRATRIVAIPLNEKSAKIRAEGAVNDVADADAPIWSGHIPMTTRFESPVSNNDAGAEVPAEIVALAGQDVHRQSI